jgi:hypothetical protein
MRSTETVFVVSSMLQSCLDSTLQNDSKLLSGFLVAYHFQTGSNKIKLLVEYESVTQNPHAV